MQLKQNQNSHFLAVKSLLFLIVVILALGIFFRVANLDGKVYWTDEVLTSVRISGYRRGEISTQLYNGSVIGIQDLQKYQYPNSEKDLFDVVNAMGVEAGAHVPLYFILTRFWLQLFGNSIVVTRGFSVFCSLLTFPFIYLLCLELFNSSLVGMIAIALTAISPFHVLYAQEARPYSLWTLIIVLSSWALLRALRLKNTRSWSIYSVTTALGFYTFLYSCFVSLGQGIYVFCLERFRWTKTVKEYLLAISIGCIFFVPWILVILFNQDKVLRETRWLTKTLEHGVPELALRWGLHISRIFIDFDINFDFGFENLFPYIIIVLAFVALTGYAIYFLCRHTPPQTWLLIVMLIVIPALGTILPDLILGGQRSGTTRYLVPCYVGIQLAVAYLLATKITSTSIQQRVWYGVMVIIFSLGVMSCVNSFNAEDWWNKSGGQRPQIARLINQTEMPLIISEYTWQHVISLSYLLEADVKFQFIDKTQDVPTLPDNFSDYFFYNVTPDSIEAIQQKYAYRITPVIYQSNKVKLWHLNVE
jgi:uncharacterized membrane protein